MHKYLHSTHIIGTSWFSTSKPQRLWKEAVLAQFVQPVLQEAWTLTDITSAVCSFSWVSKQMLWASRMPLRRAELDRLPSVLTKDEKNKLSALEKADFTEEDKREMMSKGTQAKSAWPQTRAQTQGLEN